MKGRDSLSGLGRRCIEVAAGLLTPAEREAVLGDLAEMNVAARSGMADVLGLVVRRQLQLLMNWRPWAALFGLTVPGSLLLMGVSVSFSSMSERLVDHKIFLGSSHALREFFVQFICRGLLLIGGSWVCGFVLGSIARKTLWISIAVSCFPCLFCLVRFREPSLSRFCLFLFLLPAIWGLRHALRAIRINVAFALSLAIAITTLTVLPMNSQGVWALNWSLVWPAWYLVVVTARGDGRNAGQN